MKPDFWGKSAMQVWRSIGMAPLSQACNKTATAVSLLPCLVHERGPCRFQLLQVKVSAL